MNGFTNRLCCMNRPEHISQYSVIISNFVARIQGTIYLMGIDIVAAAARLKVVGLYIFDSHSNSHSLVKC